MRVPAIFALLLVPYLSSCSLFIEAADISHRQANEVEKGSVVAGDGFTVRAPATGLHPKRNYPAKGGVTFRPVETFRDGLVYFVSPLAFPAAKA